MFSQGLQFGPTWLIFGCRDPSLDLLFPTELDEHVEYGTLTHLCLCFSRHSADLPAPPIIPQSIYQHACVPLNCCYVQDCILSARNIGLSPDISDGLTQLSIRDSADRSHSQVLARLVVHDGAHIRVSCRCQYYVIKLGL